MTHNWSCSNTLSNLRPSIRAWCSYWLDLWLKLVVIKTTRLLLCLGAIVVATGCATSTQRPNPTVWEPSEPWWAKAERNQAHLTQPNGGVVKISPQAARSLRRAQSSLSGFVTADYDLGLADIEFPNAYAIKHKGRSKVIIGLPLISLIGDDHEAYAFVLAHELAHHELGHATNNPSDNPARAREQAGAALGTISSMIVPFSGILVNQLMVTWGRYYSREQERAADDHAFLALERAGISGCGAWRLLDRLEARKDTLPSLPSFLSTHPALSERRQKTAC